MVYVQYRVSHSLFIKYVSVEVGSVTKILFKNEDIFYGNHVETILETAVRPL